MRAVLIEDEAPAAQRLTQLLGQHPDVQVEVRLASVEEAVAWFASHPAPDLIFADIQLADGLSFEIFDAVAVRSPIVFTTSYDEYALQAFSLHSVDYLLKPINAGQLGRALGKYQFWQQQEPARQQQLSNAQLLQMQQLLDALPLSPPRYRQRFLVSTGEQLLPVPVGEVAYFFTAHELVYLVRRDGRRFPVDYKLDQLEKLLDPAQFFRVNRQYLAAMPAVEKIYTYLGGKLKLELLPAAGEEVLVSRERAPALKRWLE
ncbi:LytTR family DNA-binding domain-containing protein [Hymenobacter sp. 15J16-1T3B]|uniref:LytR/AlgR family response regulator transcription factor n=1 Tax=Hymenobacter sp. 15J16-1T3B TaxID=2886941 RepID=UPI001D0F7A6C|nr:LytTR family DNA-binding domain-containing protein [Hymenobacter sp. 15J16-1T3B]MCC3160471.1 LytTR family DNA-binding domain-containing protein [Hymenobacter sp. 15J16-1T3B]